MTGNDPPPSGIVRFQVFVAALEIKPAGKYLGKDGRIMRAIPACR